MKEIGFICIGKAGSSIGQLLYEQGYKVCFIDSNLADIQYLNIGFHLKKHIPASYGCGGDRSKSQQFTEMYYDDLLEFIESALPNKQLYIFITSQGGGTGSGMTPVLSHILGLKHNVAIISIMPSNMESIDILKNSLEFLSEISDIDHPCKAHFIYDNGTDNKININNIVAEDITSLLTIPDTYSHLESIDKADILSQLSYSNGYSIISKFNATKETFRDSLYHALKNSSTPSPQFDKCMGGLLVSYGFTQDYGLSNEIIQEFASANIRKHENFIDRNNNHIALLTGLSLPYNRIEQIKTSIKVQEENIKHHQNNYDFGISSNNKVDNTKINLIDVISRYKK